ncbi:MAG: homocysteine biosynthesis protein [Candidatus Omnitrophica bacterium]|nr:homocysteine biosynthesis protein [Candidatus Omnitrophota bacterium]MBU1046992.1 homocysteine biosynthesis protein [Candidatus Omnitrophota bacterium]MBU1767269.1 homocysteine biosynthesis protein [Candidatus Omnitrophota bacterium]MBU1889538.1 homocysteine biosynthesis protein [Candidatus Omnitrophota bacterium]
MPRTIKEINEKIKKGKAVIVRADEVPEIVNKKGYKKAAEQVDVVTTGTFGPMCSSGVFINFGHSKPKIKASKAWLNDVEAYAGLAAVDIYLGATRIPDNDPANKIYPGTFSYGGGHVIEELVKGEDIKLKVTSYGTDCYPSKQLNTLINIKDLNEVILFNPRNSYQNYNVAVNLSNKIIYTYMGILQPNLGNANYCSAGELSPLLNDPYYKTIGIGTRIFLGGGIGYVTSNGTQHNPSVKRTPNGVPSVPAGTLALTGDVKKMSAEWLRGVSMAGYGVSLAVGIGIPIPIISEEMLKYTAVKDENIQAQIVDYSYDYPQGTGKTIGTANYAQLKSGEIKIKDKLVSTASLSSYSKAKEIAETLKKWIKKGGFLLTEPVELIPSSESEVTFKSLKKRPIK